jgi:hypothetical protein
MRMHDVLWLFTASTMSIATTSCSSINSAQAEEPCVTSLGSQTELGTHWYYHVDRATNRKCWYPTRVGQQASGTRLAESTAGTTKKMPRALPKQEKAAANVLPLDATTREVLFRRFLEWRQRQLVGTEFQTFLGEQQEESYTQ